MTGMPGPSRSGRRPVDLAASIEGASGASVRSPTRSPRGSSNRSPRASAAMSATCAGSCPAPTVILQVDEPSLTAVLEGTCRRPPASGRCVRRLSGRRCGTAHRARRTTGPGGALLPSSGRPALRSVSPGALRWISPRQRPLGGSRSAPPWRPAWTCMPGACPPPEPRLPRGCGRAYGRDGACRSRPAVARPHHRHSLVRTGRTHTAGAQDVHRVAVDTAHELSEEGHA